MSEQKRPGVRDISDLKARLGLKKKAKAGRPGRGAIPPPAGMKLPGGVPAPPGAEPPAPQVTDDPFGAMNRAAAVAAQHRAPEIIIVNDGKPVEQVSTKNKAIGYAKVAGIVLLPLILGMVVGQISSGAKTYNRTIRDAGRIADNIKDVRRSLVGLKNALLTAKEGGGYKASDKTLTDALAALKLVEPNINVAYKSFMYNLEPASVDGVLDFYNGTTRHFEAVKTHLRLAKRDNKSLIRGAANLKAVVPDNKLTPYRFGIYIDIPTAQEAANGKKFFGAKLVELSNPICEGQNKPSTDIKCPGPVKGFRYRVGSTGSWGVKELANVTENGNVPGAKLLPLLPTGTLNGIIRGAEPTVAETAYLKRIRDIETTTDKLIELGTGLEQKLKAKANSGEKFTFFL